MADQLKVLNKLTLRKDSENYITYTIGDIIEGYYRESSDKFYEDNLYTKEIEGSFGFLYIDIYTNKQYRYDTLKGFIVVGGGGVVESVVQGYYNENDNNFYEDDTFTILISPDSEYIYVDINNNYIYRYNPSEDIYVVIGGGNNEPATEEEINTIINKIWT